MNYKDKASYGSSPPYKRRRGSKKTDASQTLCVQPDACLHRCIHLCTYVQITSVYICVYICVCRCTCVYICVYICSQSIHNVSQCPAVCCRVLQCAAVCPIHNARCIQGGEDPCDAFCGRSFFAKEPLIIAFFCGKWPVRSGILWVFTTL